MAVVAAEGQLNFNTKKADNFSGYNVKKSNMTFKMCKTPSKKNWDRYDLSSKDYTTTFDAGEDASFLVKLSKKPKSSSNRITTLFVIRDENGNIECLTDGSGNHYPIPVRALFVSDKGHGGLEAPDSNTIQWSFLPNYSDDLVIVAPSDFNPLTDLQ